MLILEAHDVFWEGNEGFKLSGLNLRIHAGERWGIAGMAGSGKTSFTKILAGISHLDRGWVRFMGETHEDPRELLIPGHPQIAYLSQFFELPRNYKVAELIEYDSKLSEAELAVLAKRCRLHHLLRRKSQNLSGGEKQRLALARLLVRKPRMLILDEPFSNLDLIHRNILKDILDELEREDHLTIMIVAHDPMDLLPWADQLMLLHEGSMLQWGSPNNVFYKPVNEIAAALLGGYNKLAGADWKQLFPSLKLENEQQYLLRPSNVKLEASEEGELTVIHSRFYGTHWQVAFAKNNIAISGFSFSALKNGQKLRAELTSLNLIPI